MRGKIQVGCCEDTVECRAIPKGQLKKKIELCYYPNYNSMGRS